MPYDPTTGGRAVRGPSKALLPDRRIDMVEQLILKNRQRLTRHATKRHTTFKALERGSLQANSPVGVEGELASDTEGSLWVYLNGQWTERFCPALGPVTYTGPILYSSYYSHTGGVDNDYLVTMDYEGNYTMLSIPFVTQDYNAVWNW